ncbi:MAG: hypothetical protein ACKO3N_11305 [Verrucomicrobiota bacterium]
MLAAVVLAGLVPATWAQVLGLAVWTATMCFTWPVLEALVSEHEDPGHLPARVGLYNVVWAGTAAAGVFFGGTLYRRLGPASLYWLPALVHLAQFLVLGPLKRRHDAWLAIAPPVPSHAAAAAADPRKPRYFLRLAWIGNPFNYMAVNTLLAMVPAIGVKVGVSIEQVGWLMSLWYITRTLGFLVLWFWPGWHYHFGWFLAAFLTLLASFTTLLVTHAIWVLVVAQVFFGAASALLYYSALFYTMDGSDTKGAHGGIHEAFIGLGIFGGPAVSTAAVALTGRPESPAWAIGLFLAAGAALAVGIRLRHGRHGRARPAAASVVA